MGIQGLLPMLKEIQEHGHVSHFKGKRLAVDAYVWLHKGAFGCAEDLVKGSKTTKFVDYAMHRVRLLRHFGIEPYIVFDGGPLPAKKVTEVSRAQSRAENLERAQSLERQGRRREARDYYTKCLDITPEMAYQLIKALRAESVEYVVAPYEADAQLCYLEKEGIVDGIITEDSDLLVFGCKQVIFKLDGNGQCVWINREKFGNASQFPMHGWTETEFRRMAMLSGCDYLPSIQGIGLKTAHRLLRRHKTVEKVLQNLRLEGNLDVPVTYLAQFAQAELAFIYQRVFCPLQRTSVPLNTFPSGGLSEEDTCWVGVEFEVNVARSMASGDLHPESREAIKDLWPDYRPVGLKSSKPQKNVLGESSKPNVAAGPMDAFITRKAGKAPSKMAVAFQPVGRGSAVSSITDQVLLNGSANAMAGPSRRARPSGGKLTASKFFSRGKTETQKLEADVQAAATSLVWERSDDDGPDIDFSQTQTPTRKRQRTEAGKPSSPDQDIQSPSSCGSPTSRRVSSSSRGASPGPIDENDTRDGETSQAVSPTMTIIPRSGFTSPAHVSSPVAEACDSYSQDPFSPPSKPVDTLVPRQRSATPPSPIVSSPLAKPTSRSQITHGFVAETQLGDPLSSRQDPPPKLGSRGTSKPVLIPPSSPGHDNALGRYDAGADTDANTEPASSSSRRSKLVQCSSDSIDEDELRTPSFAELVSRRNPEEEEDDLVVLKEKEQAQAQTFGLSLREKFAFGSAFPAPRSTRTTITKTATIRTTDRPNRTFPNLKGSAPHTPTPYEKPKSKASRVLQSRAANCEAPRPPMPALEQNTVKATRPIPGISKRPRPRDDENFDGTAQNKAHVTAVASSSSLSLASPRGKENHPADPVAAPLSSHQVVSSVSSQATSILEKFRYKGVFL